MELRTLFQSIAAAIRAREGSAATIQASAFPERILNLPSGTDTSDATAAVGDVLSGKTAYAGGEKITGTIPIRQAAVITPGTAAQTAAAAGTYAAGDVTVAGDGNLIPAHIKNGVSIFGVTGNLLAIASESPAISGNGRAYYGGLTAQVRPVDVTLDRENNCLLVSFNIYATYSSTRAEGSGTFQIDIGA